MFRKLLHILATASVLVGCTADVIQEPVEEGMGYLMLNFGEEDLTKAVSSQFADFPVVIKGNDSDFEMTDVCGALPDVLAMAPGSYTITVTSPDMKPAAFDTPIYSSSENFTITEGVTSSVTIVLSNLRVSVILTAELRGLVSSCNVTVSNDTGSLTWSLEDIDSGRIGYFQPSSFLEINAAGTKTDGNGFTFNGIMTDIESGALHNITLEAL